MKSNILVISPGLETSIQDLGRKGYRRFGVPIAGAMDKYSAILANKLLNNEEGLPVMEITQIGPKLFFEDETLIVITGADISAKLNDEAINLNMVYHVKMGDVLNFSRCNYGSRAYLGVKGGFLTEIKLGSYAYFKGVTTKKVIAKGDRLEISNYISDQKIGTSKVKVIKAHFNTKKIEVTKGPEYNRLTKNNRERLFTEEFVVDVLNNRMGYHLKNEYFKIEKNEIITSTLIPGTVQLTPSGKLIVMMRNCPTTGGYPRILQLTDIAINQLAQKKTGDTFKFELESSFSFLSRLVYKI